MSAPLPPRELKYDAAVAELEQLIAELDRGTVDIDTLSVRFQRAIDIVEELDGRIHKSREQIETLMPRLDTLDEKG